VTSYSLAEVIDISEECTASMFRVQEYAKRASNEQSELYEYVENFVQSYLAS
jgi:hypothetical protein